MRAKILFDFANGSTEGRIMRFGENRHVGKGKKFTLTEPNVKDRMYEVFGTVTGHPAHHAMLKVMKGQQRATNGAGREVEGAFNSSWTNEWQECLRGGYWRLAGIILRDSLDVTDEDIVTLRKGWCAAACLTLLNQIGEFRCKYVDGADSSFFDQLEDVSNSDRSTSDQAAIIRDIMQEVSLLKSGDPRILALQTCATASEKLTNDVQLCLFVREICAVRRSTKGHTVEIEAKHGYASKIASLRSATSESTITLRGESHAATRSTRARQKYRTATEKMSAIKKTLTLDTEAVFEGGLNAGKNAYVSYRKDAVNWGGGDPDLAEGRNMTGLSSILDEWNQFTPGQKQTWVKRASENFADQEQQERKKLVEELEKLASSARETAKDEDDFMAKLKNRIVQRYDEIAQTRSKLSGGVAQHRSSFEKSFNDQFVYGKFIKEMPNFEWTSISDSPNKAISFLIACLKVIHPSQNPESKDKKTPAAHFSALDVPASELQDALDVLENSECVLYQVADRLEDLQDPLSHRVSPLHIVCSHMFKPYSFTSAQLEEGQNGELRLPEEINTKSLFNSDIDGRDLLKKAVKIFGGLLDWQEDSEGQGIGGFTIVRDHVLDVREGVMEIVIPRPLTKQVKKQEKENVNVDDNANEPQQEAPKHHAKSVQAGDLRTFCLSMSSVIFLVVQCACSVT